MPAAPVTRRANPLIRAWQTLGGGSLTFSVCLHLGILVVAGLVVFTSRVSSSNIDFLPGGGTQGSQESADLAQRMQTKKRAVLKKSIPTQRVVSTSLNTSMTLPEMAPDTLHVPESNSLATMGLPSGGFGAGGSGGGFGNATGMGAAKGFVGMTLFGKLGGEGLPGVLVDMKQSPDRKPTEYAGEVSEAMYARIINKTAAKRFSDDMLKDFFHSTQKMSFTFLAIPNLPANEAPKAFHVEHEVQPRGWMVHYGGTVQPPAPGDYRFVGFFDDALIVYVNGKPVLDGSWYPIVGNGEKKRDESVRQDFGGPVIPGTSNRHAYAGKWIKLEGSTRIDIVVGERPGGRFGGVLQVQARNGKYQKRDDGSPILPVFTTTKLTSADLTRLQEYAKVGNGYEIALEAPLFDIRKTLFEK